MAIEDVVNNLGRTKVVAIRYGAWSSDDYNINNPTDNNARVSYYGQGTGTPRAWVDGGNHMVGSVQIPAQVLGHVNNRLSVNSPYELDISINPGTDSITVKVKCTSTPPTGNKYLRIAMIEKIYNWPTAPGSNGQTHYENCLLDMVPDAAGTLLNIAVGDSQLYSFGYNSQQVSFHPAPLEALRSAVAFIQNDQTKEVLQAGYGEVGLSADALIAGALIDNTTPAVLNGYVYYTAPSSIDIDIGINGQIPSGWNVTANCNSGTIPVNNGTATFTVTGQDSFYYNINIDPMGISGGMIVDADINLTSNPTISTFSQYSVTTNDVDILVVDAESENAETYITSSLSNVYNGTFGIVNRAALHQPGLDLSNFEVITWSSGMSFPAFYPEEVTVLETYLNGGGNLFISGQDIGSDIFESTGQSQFAQSFYNNYLHADYVANSMNTFLMNGYDGDPITDGVSFVVTYVPNQLSLEEIAPYDANATPILKYMFGPSIGAIKAETNNYKVIYMGVGFEQIPSSATQDTIMARSLRWFNEVSTGLNTPNSMPTEFSLGQNYPNPFNPGTNISYSLAEQSTVNLIIYNTLGQKIRTLISNKKQTANQHQIYWDGKDDFGNLISTGVYYYKLVARNNNKTFEESKKMIFFK